MKTTTAIPLAQLEPAPWNPNRASNEILDKLRRSITDFGIVENLVVRPHPTTPGAYEVISGNQRLTLYRRLQLGSVPCHIVELDDGRARLLAQTLNRTRGVDDPEAYGHLLDKVLSEFSLEDVLAYLPESEHSIDRLLAQHGLGRSEPGPAASLIGPPSEPESKPGQLYELGPHRLLCGDATNPEHVQELMQGEQAALMATDPPYGISLDHTWRDGIRQPSGSARTGRVANDDRCDWHQAYVLTDAPVAYVWHSALHAREAWDALAAAGFEIRQQIVWVKEIHALSRAHYQWQHECAWYAVRSGSSGGWTRRQRPDDGVERALSDHELRKRGRRRRYSASDPEAACPVREADPQSHRAGRGGVRALRRLGHAADRSREAWSALLRARARPRLLRPHPPALRDVLRSRGRTWVGQRSRSSSTCAREASVRAATPIFLPARTSSGGQRVPRSRLSTARPKMQAPAARSRSSSSALSLVRTGKSPSRPMGVPVIVRCGRRRVLSGLRSNRRPRT